MNREPNWRAFYEELCKRGLDVLGGVDEHLEQVIPFHVDSDVFWSESLELVLKERWCEDPERAVREVIAIWARNVRARMGEIYEGVGKNVFVFFGEDEEDVLEPRTMIEDIRPRYGPRTIRRLIEAARTEAGE
jgi:hypothetical protein